MNKEERCANQFLDDLGINIFPINPFEICASQDISVFQENFDGIDGVLLFDGDRAAIGINSRQTYPKRRNFSVAHELGHLNLDVTLGEKKKFTCSSKMIESFDNKNSIELRADRFASELLMPIRMVENHFNPKEPCWNSIQQVSNDFDVSLMASAFKFINISTISCCLIVSKSGQIQFYRPSNGFRYSLQMTDSRIIAEETFAYKSRKSQNVPNNFDIVSANSWIAGHKVTKNSELLEWSLPLNSYGQVLTLLWDDETVEVDNDEERVDSESYYIEDKSYSYGGAFNFPWEPPTLGKRK